MPWKEKWAKKVQVLCDSEADTAQQCYDLLLYIGGPDEEEINKVRQVSPS